MSNTYLTTLIERQQFEGWSDREMARQLGVGKSTWSRIKRGERGIGPSVLRRTMMRFPEYNHLALLFLLQNAPERGINGNWREHSPAAAGAVP